MDKSLDLFEKNNENKNAQGGSEIMAKRLYSSLPKELLKEFQIILSRVRYIDESKYRIYWCHDSPNEPEIRKALENEGHRKFHVIACVSNWQAQQIVEKFTVPWSKIVVMLNAIEPLENKTKNKDTINLIYHTTPHRGLQILISVFDKLCEKHKNIHLDLYSSFDLYNWGHRDKNYQELFDFADQHPHITNHGSQSQDIVRKAVSESHIFAYPSIWRESSCLCLMESMSAGLACVHPNYGALYETGSCWSFTYNFNEDLKAHAGIFYQVLDEVINNYWQEPIQQRCKAQSMFANAFYAWKIRAKQWEALLSNILNSKLPKEIPPPSTTQFKYDY